MERKLKLSLLLIGISFYSMSQNPVEWKFTSKKIKDQEYEIHLVAIIQNPWHIYSQFTPEGGPVPTSVSFNKNPLVDLQGEAMEAGKLEQKHEEVFGMDVKYFGGKVDFVRIIKVKGKAKTNISGMIEYMVCNDRECLPPKKIPFNVKLE